MEFKSGSGIWEELKLHHSISSCWFDIVAVVDVAQLECPISEQVTKIHRCFAICDCDLHPFYSYCHTLRQLDSSANEIYHI